MKCNYEVEYFMVQR